MIINFLLLVGGMLLLIKGADWLIDGASALAKKNNISDLAIGLTIVAFGTSAPELVVNAFAAYHNQPDIVFGNIIGSNNFNLFLILGITGLITPLAVQASTVWKEIPISLLAVLLLAFFANDHLLWGSQNIMGRLDGIMLIALFIGFLFYVFKQLKADPASSAQPYKQLSLPKVWLLIVVGLSGLVVGGKLVVDSAVDIAVALHVSKKVIGLTIVAAGTSLPELVTSVVAALKKNNDIAVGNIIGSNIFNIFFILATSILIHPMEFDPEFNVDLLFLAAGTLFLFFAMFTGKKKKLDRWEAMLLLGAFCGYMVYLFYAH